MPRWHAIMGNEAIVRYIKKDEANIRKTAAIIFNTTAKREVTPHDKRIVKTEAALALWIADSRKKREFGHHYDQDKAKSLYDQTLPDHDEGDAEGESGQPQDRTSSATSDSPTQGRGFTASKGYKKGTASEVCLCMMRLPLLTPIPLVIT